jgi:hypothetical protein
MRILKQIIESDDRSAIGLPDQFSMQLGQLLDFMLFVNTNKRSLDSYAEIFMFHVNRYRNQPRSSKKTGSLSSKDVVWALHSNQKDTLW